jgi:hypothetical protein
MTSCPYLAPPASAPCCARSTHTPSLDHWSAAREEARREHERLKAEIISTTQVARPRATLLTAGQSVGGITDIPGLADLMRPLVAEAEDALARAPALVAIAPSRPQAASGSA